MFFAKGLNMDCIELIADFAGITENWKLRFSMDVLTQIDQGWVEVGVKDGVPCANCYMYHDTVFCEDGLCLNCCDDDEVDEKVMLNFQSIKPFSKYRCFDKFEHFKKRRDVYLNTFTQITQSDIENSSLFREIQMLNNV